MTQTVLQYGEVIVEVNRARDRETPVAFTDIGKDRIDERIHGQDAPLLLRGTPGLYAFSTDGVGNGEAKLFVRGFNQNYVQVLINGIPTNDPESNSVYWSNWGSVSSAAASVQVQRGAGSSMYGAGAFGGSFNIVTGNARPQRYYGVNLSFGDPTNTMYGVDLSSGLINDAYAFTLRMDRKVGNGNRIGSRYEGYNYYFSGSWFMDEQQSLKLVLHGAPQVHTYAFSNDISYFKYFNYKANTAPWLPRSVVNQLPVNGTTGAASYGLLDGSRELVTDDIVGLAHNHFHKPQIELHYSNDLTSNSAVRATLFFSRGRGGGSSLNSGGSVSNALRGPDGSINTLATATTYLGGNAYQRDSYSLHQQWGILTNYEFQPSNELKVTAGAEFRSWTADHPGHFTNLYGKTSITAQPYGTTRPVGTDTSFARRTYQGDVSQTNDMAIFGWDLSSTDPQYRTQYRNYRGETPQYTIFASANYNLLPNFMLTGTLQYVWYQYKLIENMPSESAIGRQLTPTEVTTRGLTSASQEGPVGNGKFLMTNATTTTWHEFDLVNATRSRGFIQPKFGANFNLDENINIFGNYSHVERFVDLSIYYNSGRLNPDAKDEISNQFELGAGWTSSIGNAKINAYTMTWENKSQRITDVSQAGQPGYDRNGNKSILVGTATFKGIEFEANSRLGNIWPMLSGFEVRGSATFSDNKWESVLPEAKIVGGVRAVFNSGARNAAGNTDPLYVDELAGTNVGGPPQMMMSFGATYRWSDFFVGVDVNYYENHYGLDGDTYIRVDGTWNATKTVFTYTLKKRLPPRTITDAQAGYRFTIAGLKGIVSTQVLNVFNVEHLADVDNFGVQPGVLRTLRFNASIGI
ncbi:MAG: TonB-dependent receptor [Bacteroidota bacterium]